ncbi:glycosyltransferase [Leptolyngbya sp. 7M]|uniref:glycosyltransferase n=1 Tax=Leptolyngbya sp. 7M TaxID=2812896 RepID=UPI0028F4504F|nr:glycosyltransferase [Leptolyngbya sp. 7M]
MFSPEEIAERNTWHRTVARNAPIIVLSSNMAKQDFDRLYPDAASRSVVMHFATALVPEWFQLNPLLTQAKYGLPDRFFLVSNQFWKHKDHNVIIKALDLLKQQRITPLVVCTGKTFDPRHPEYCDQLLRSIEELGLSEQIRILGLIPRSDQIQLMRRCLAVIQPSRFEGWSTVVEDTRTLGKPILLSDFPVHLEQNPPYAEFFEQGNVEQLTKLIANAYAQLKPGPDFDKEDLAKQDNLKRVQAFGYKFLEIVRKTI